MHHHTPVGKLPEHIEKTVTIHGWLMHARGTGNVLYPGYFTQTRQYVMVRPR